MLPGRLPSFSSHVRAPFLCAFRRGHTAQIAQNAGKLCISIVHFSAAEKSVEGAIFVHTNNCCCPRLIPAHLRYSSRTACPGS